MKEFRFSATTSLSFMICGGRKNLYSFPVLSFPFDRRLALRAEQPIKEKITFLRSLFHWSVLCTSLWNRTLEMYRKRLRD